VSAPSPKPVAKNCDKMTGMFHSDTACQMFNSVGATSLRSVEEVNSMEMPNSFDTSWMFANITAGSELWMPA